MPSPFPGMDPYLEAPGIWPGFHNRLAIRISDELNGLLPPSYYAEIEERAELGIIEEGGALKPIVADVAVMRHPASFSGVDEGAVAVATRPRRKVTPQVELEVLIEPIRHLYVEIREAKQGHRLVTLIEILSPSNKRPGPDHEAYRTKQRQVLESDASLIELDLLRGGHRVVADPRMEAELGRLTPAPTYVAMISRGWRRGAGLFALSVSPIGLRDPLPCIPVPLKQGEEEVPLDLQYVFDQAYDSGPYRRGAVDYAGPVPAPALVEEDAAWAAERTRPWREAQAQP